MEHTSIRWTFAMMGSGSTMFANCATYSAPGASVTELTRLVYHLRLPEMTSEQSNQLLFIYCTLSKKVFYCYSISYFYRLLWFFQRLELWKYILISDSLSRVCQLSRKWFLRKRVLWWFLPKSDHQDLQPVPQHMRRMYWAD